MKNRLPAALTIAAVAALSASSAVAQIPQSPAADLDDAPRAPHHTDEELANMPEPRIVGGTQAREGDWPYMGRLRAMTSETGGFTCGATMISPDILLTAEHCLQGGGGYPDPSWAQVYVGKVDWKQARGNKDHHFKADSRRQFFLGDGPRRGDWALIRLNKPRYLSSYAKIASDASLDDAPMYRAIGWGKTSFGGESSQYLLEVDLKNSPEKNCRNSFAELCVGGHPEGGKDTCQGDSGGPLFTKNRRNEWVQVGITSRGAGCARPNTPGYYTKISRFYNDILRGIDSLGGMRPGETIGGPGPTTEPTTPGPTTPGPTTPGPTTPGPTTPGPTTPGPTSSDPAPSTFADTTPYDLQDYRTAKSTITSTYRGAGKVNLAITVDHPCAEDLGIAVTTPDGTRNVVKRATYAWRCTPWNGTKDETYPLRSESAGDWTLEMSDERRGNTGRMTKWQISFS